jgi:FKBP-type peptidyl-prolyl cis-trans isomerase 2
MHYKTKTLIKRLCLKKRMADKINKNDFIELKFTGKIKDGEIFDTNIEEDAKKINMDLKKIKPLLISVGHNMVIKGLDKALEGKELGVSYSLEFNPEQAFGKRESSLIKMIPSKNFTEQKIYPQRGMQLSLDGMLIKIISVSGGRVLVDFNNPLAGRNIIYNFKAERKLADINEKINALQDSFFKKQFKFEIKGGTINFKVPKKLASLMELFKKPFEDILNLKISSEIIDEKEEKAEDKKEGINEIK